VRWLWFSTVWVLLLTSAAAADSPTDPSYRIGPKDRLRITVAELSDANTDQAVTSDGSIDLAIIGPIEVRGYTVGELSVRLGSLFEGRGIRKATVSVEVLEFRAQPLTVFGAVNGQATLPGRGRALLLDVLSDAGGLSDDHGDKILIRRTASNGLSDEIEISVADLMQGLDPRVNIPILAGDIINVPPAAEHTVYFLGEMSGSLNFSGGERVTLLAAIAKNGGLGETASKKIIIRRQTPSGEVVQIKADYRRIVDGKDKDVPLTNGDMIVVKESFF
jgi:polysaccharide export outer membrane protein